MKCQKKNLKIYFGTIFLFGILFLTNLISAIPLNCSLPDIMALWKFDENQSDKIYDSCHNYSGQIYGTPVWDFGKYKNSLNFDGGTNYVDLGNILNETYHEYSFSLWVKMDYYIAYQTLFQRGNYYTNEFVEALQVNEGDNDYIVFMNTNSIGILSIDNGSWFNVVGTFNGSSNTSKLYINGNFISSADIGYSDILETANNLYFGVNYANGFLLKGNLDEIAFFNRTLIPDEIKNYYDDYICSPIWYCSEYNQTCSGVYPSNFECLKVEDSSTCCNKSNLYENCVYTGNLSDYDFHFVVENITANVQTYPYIELNQTYPIQLNFPTNPFSDVKIYITELDGNVSIFNFSYFPNYYYLTLLFTEEGNYPFMINGTNPCFDLDGEVRGIFMARKSYNVTFCGFRTKTLDKYENDFSYLTAELTSSKIYGYDTSLETFLTPLLFKDTFKTPVFHTYYYDGCGTLRIFEKNQEYAIRLFDGVVTFPYTFSQPNISKTYGTNIYLGKYYFNGSNQNINVYFSEKDINPYKWLFNLIFVITIIMVFIISIFLFFMIPSSPSLSIIFGLGGIISLTLIRIILWFWIG